MKKLLLLVFTLLLITIPTLAQDVTITPDTPTPTPQPVTLHLLVERDWLVIYVANAEPLWLRGLQLRTQNRTSTLETDFDILLLADGFAPPGACFVYRLAGSTLPLPGVCTQPNRIFQREVPRADVFWYDFVTFQPRAIAVIGAGVSSITGELCPASLPDCPVTWLIPPTPTPVPTDIPTPGPTAAPTLTPDGTLPVLALSARCDGNNALFFVSNQGASLLHSIRWNGYIGGVYNQGGVIQPINSGVQNFFFFRFVSTDGYETRIELEAAKGVRFENGGTVSITCPEGTASAAPMATAMQTTKGYPCEGAIVSISASTLNVVRSSPSDAAPLSHAVKSGSTVTIISKLSASGKEWYQIVFNNSQTTGWILAEYIVPSATCE